ncbi:hypothetical protein C8034_v008527 [Colletotrichum sidae]|uniref:2EXR domain-containing protein n=1 Tax=Colletotrichum sidae TaxID=1347389 RepID=A0A4R8T2F8_9PEZI|nr:hypothetical protein C8034_v008527 [Colletotrichum sidae]
MTEATDIDVAAQQLGCIQLDSSLSQSFHLFPDLPPELRVMIWRSAVPTRGSVVERIWDNSIMDYVLRRHVPVSTAVYACQESRAELVYDSRDPHGAREGQLEELCLTKADGRVVSRALFNPEKDTLLFYRAPPNIRDFANVQHLAMEWGLRPCWLQGHLHQGMALLQQFPALKTLTLLVKFKLDASQSHGTPPELKRRQDLLEKKALREIRGWLGATVDEARRDSPEWVPPEIRVVPRTSYWNGKARV